MSMEPLPFKTHPTAKKQEISSRRLIDSTLEAVSSLTPELVIALCGPIGSPLHETAAEVEKVLSDFGYRARTIRLSGIISMNASMVGMAVDGSSKFNRTNSLIDIGDVLRERFGADILAKIAIAKISADRQQSFGPSDDAAKDTEQPHELKIAQQRTCHIVDSIKNQSELDLLRLIYGDALFAIGVFSPPEIRRQTLLQPGNFSEHEIEKLIDKDSGEEFSHGQSVRNTFPACDFFLRVDEPIFEQTEKKHLALAQIGVKLKRLFGLLFHTTIVSPTSEENAMYAAASASRNSACLSRQVGAAVTSTTGEILALGWNDVPQAGGGLYGKPILNSTLEMQQTQSDKRCYSLPNRKCHNDEEKRGIARKIAEILNQAGLLDDARIESAIEKISSDSRVKDLIEFSRAVHAEMHAILGASRVAGERIVGGKIFVTTYPCHACARHIIAAGISEVHYIEPYRKSMAIRLHQDALSEAEDAKGKVRIVQFEGVAPRRFIDLFEAGVRKDKGVLSLLTEKDARPSTKVSLKAIPRLEEAVVTELTEKELKLPSLDA